MNERVYPHADPNKRDCLWRPIKCSISASAVGWGQVTMTELMPALVIASIGGLLRGFAGVGSGMFMAPFFVHIFGPVQAIGIILLIEILATALLLPSVFREIDWPVITTMGIAAMALMPVGNRLLLSLDTRAIQLGVSVLVFLSALLLISGWRYTGARPLALTMSVGAVSGLLMALTSLGNPPVMVYLLSSEASAARNRANFTAYFGITLAALILLMTVRGHIDGQTFATAGGLLPGFLLATWIGSRLFRTSSEQSYRRIALGVLLIAGAYGIVKSL